MSIFCPVMPYRQTICIHAKITGKVYSYVEMRALSTLSQTTNFLLFQNEGVCRRQFLI